MTSTYIPGTGYTIRDARGRVIAHSLTPAQRDAVLALQNVGVISSAQLAFATGAV